MVQRPKGRSTLLERRQKLLTLLYRNPQGITLEEGAEALEVVERTVRRYLKEMDEDLTRVNCPGQKLRWLVRDVPRKVYIRNAEAYALLAARRLFEPLRGAVLHDTLEKVLEELTRLVQRRRRGVGTDLVGQRLEERFVYLPYAPRQYGDKLEEFERLFQAVAELCPLQCNYRQASSGEKKLITIHPYALVLHRGAVYAVGIQLQEDELQEHELQTFMLDHMQGSTVQVDTHFELPNGFSVDKYFAHEMGMWRGPKTQKVVIDLDAQGAEYVRTRCVHQSQRLSNLPGGGVRLTMTIGALEPVVSWVLERGQQATVVEPEELRKRVLFELKKTLSNYRPRKAK